MLIIVGGMAIGVMFGRKPIAGSCGGMAALGLDSECEVCGGNPDRCRDGKGAQGIDDLQAVQGYDLARDATAQEASDRR